MTARFDDAPRSAPRSEATPPEASRVIGFVFVTVFLDLVGFGIVIPLLPFYVQTMGGSAQTVGVLLSSFAATQLVATPFLGRLSDRFGRRRVILLSLLGNALSMVLFAVATKLRLLPLLFASRIIAGATAGNLSTCQAAIADVTDGPARAKGMGRLGAGIGLGMVLGPAIGSGLSKFGDWAPPLGAAAMAAIDLIGAFFFMPETRRAHAVEVHAASRATLLSILGQARVLLVLGLYFVTFLYMTNLQVALPLLANARFGWGKSEVGLVFVLWGVVMLVVQGLFIGRLAKMFPALGIVIAGALLSGAGLTVIAMAATPPILLLGLAGLGMGLGITQPVLATLATEYAGSERRGTVLGVAQAAGGLARTIGPTFSGYLYENVTPAAPFLGGAIAAVVALALGVVLSAVHKSGDA